ncbi:uncharacterized protein M421DRAFT_416995 [Didymella exigua CBS 183.55]|uniref:Uncharacterized protein n=1 Tax=Didymella exigua CBS 183.55 TaxID=1150837 RepID=A0A6A5RWM6_9PLEO|nr:uncharacterized protein M421DRAFT_416995 [Didymella exigua CBS 183.55]KAF1932272.1 hypothetical protein M421DRAFT_416995 [Didymella exigua CBS 183.55]
MSMLAINATLHMHDRDVVHLVEKVQIPDLKNAAYLPKPRCIEGMLAGNDNWHSPASHFKGELYKPSNLYSFRLVYLRCSGACHTRA